MTTTVHIGRTRKQTCKGSDLSTIPIGALNVTSSVLAIATVTVDPTTNEVRILGVASGASVLVYQANGYASFTSDVLVAALPSIVVTDGPEV